MTKYSYYPGCTLRTKAKDLDVYARACARALGFELEEVEEWQKQQSEAFRQYPELVDALVAFNKNSRS